LFWSSKRGWFAIQPWPVGQYPLDHANLSTPDAALQAVVRILN